ncbi:MAG: hypothetical protein HY275_11400, partial [Gemmatimonadetes bacterium]|nr:hypothetical protein [Gemmatimonadota bacterium]
MPRTLLLLGATLLLASCDSQPDPRAASAPASPASLAGRYDLWICATAECGPGATSPGTRVGRLELVSERAPVLGTDSSAAFHGCAALGTLAKLDSATAPVAVRWKAGDVAGRVEFTMVQNARAEYEVSMDDLGGLMKGEARWRRDGIISDEAPEVVVARRATGNAAMSCPAPAPAA